MSSIDSPPPGNSTVVQRKIGRYYDDSAEHLKYVTGDVVAALIVKPRQILQSPEFAEPLSGILEDYIPDSPINPTRVDLAMLLVTPLKTTDVSHFWNTSEPEPADAEGANLATSESLPDPPDAPDLDHLFEGLRPEPPDDPSEQLVGRQKDPLQSLVELVIRRPVSVVFGFRDLHSATAFLQNVTYGASIEQREASDANYSVVYPRDSDPLENEDQLAFAMVEDATLIIARENRMRRILRQRESESPIRNQIREMIDGDAHAAATFVVEPFREIAEELFALATRPAEANDPQDDSRNPWASTLKSFLQVVDTGSLEINLADPFVLTCDLNCADEQHAEALATGLHQPIRDIAHFVTTEIQQWEQRAPSGALPLLGVAREWFTSTSSDVDGDRVVLKVKNVDSLRSTVMKSVPWLSQYLERTRREARLRRIGRAMLEFCEVNGRLPDNQPFGISEYQVSWRVKLLPYLGHGSLFDDYNFDEPWDSYTNRRFRRRMPRVFGNTGPMTAMMIFTGRGSPFHEDSQSLSDITDGLDQTIFAIDAGDEKKVNWHEPTDLLTDNEHPLAPLGEIPSDGLSVVFFDGHVSSIMPDIQPEMLWRLVNHQDGKPVDAELYGGR